MTAAISADGLNALFPFHIATDMNLVVVNVGPSLAKICPSIGVGRRADECFRIARPPMKLELVALRRRQRSILLLETIGEGISLYGQHTVAEEHGTILFAVAPRVLSMADMTTLGLTMHDFAPGDPVLDFMLVLQTNESILKDALQLNESLKERERSLEAAREKLVAVVEDRLRAESALTEANEDLSRRLETIVEQQALIARMSVPVIHVWDGVVALPVMGILDEERIAQLSQSMLETASRADIAIVIVDLTGIEFVREEAVGKLANIAHAAGLLGRRCLFSGVNAMLARALMATGVDIPSLSFLPNVRSAISRAIQSRQSHSRAPRH